MKSPVSPINSSIEPNQNTPESAFTLLELLVVITIISILAALLLPALTAVQASGKQIQCMSNMRQIFFGLMTYADDFDQTLPPDWNYGYGPYSDWKADPSLGNKTAALWQMEIENFYLKNAPLTYSVYASLAVQKASVFHCPADNSLWSGNYAVRNIAISGYSDPGSGSWPNPLGAPMRKIVQVREPAEVLLIIDGNSGWLSTEWGQGARIYNPAGVINTPSAFGRHKNGVNATFVDGHCEWKPISWMVNTITDTSKPPWDWNDQY